MVSLARELEQQAVTAIKLPEPLLVGIAKASVELNSADYLAALKIDQRARDACGHIQKCAKEQLQAASNLREAVIAGIKNDITQITAKRAHSVNAANYTRQQAAYDAEQIRKAVISNPSTKFIGLGCLGIVVALFILLQLTAEVFATLTRNGDVTPVFYIAVFGGLGLPIICYFLRELSIHANAEIVKRIAEASSRKALAKAEKDFKRDIATAQTALAKAEILWQKVVQAINRLQQGN